MQRQRQVKRYERYARDAYGRNARPVRLRFDERRRAGRRREPRMGFQHGRHLLAQPDVAWIVVEAAMPVNLQVVQMSNGGKATTIAGVSCANLVATAYGTVAMKSDSMTMNGTLSTWEV